MLKPAAVRFVISLLPPPPSFMSVAEGSVDSYGGDHTDRDATVGSQLKLKMQ